MTSEDSPGDVVVTNNKPDDHNPFNDDVVNNTEDSIEDGTMGNPVTPPTGISTLPVIVVGEDDDPPDVVTEKEDNNNNDTAAAVREEGEEDGGLVVPTDTTVTDLESSSSVPKKDDTLTNEEEGGGGMSLLADTASASLTGNEDGTLESHEDENYDDEEYDDDEYEEGDNEDPMPLINYSRLRGSLPRRRRLVRAPVVAPSPSPLATLDTVSAPTTTTTTTSFPGALAVPCTCSAVGKIVLDPTTMTTTSTDGGGGGVGSSAMATMSAGLDMSKIRTLTTTASSSSSFARGGGGGSHGGLGGGGDGPLDSQRPELFLSSDLWKQPHYVMALGFGTGELSIVNVQTGITVLHPEPPPASQSHHQQQQSQPYQQQRLRVRDAGSGSSSSIGSSGTNHALPSPPSGPSVVDVKFDASGNFLGAVDAGGACAIWEFKYAPSIRPLVLPEDEDEPTITTTTPSSSTTTTQAQQRPQPAAAATTAAATTMAEPTGNMFSSFMSALTGVPPTNTSTSTNPVVRANAANTTSTTAGTSTTTTTTANTPSARTAGGGSSSSLPVPPNNTRTNTNQGMIPTLAATVVQVSRITYPATFGTPTCLALDPAHKRRREKSLIVGFADGRLMLTKRGFFQRRTDSILYQGGGASGGAQRSNNSVGATGNSSSSSGDTKNYRGIEAIAWRGSLVAWADASGIKLLDSDTLTRIAHIDRPTGARPTLYPTISSLRPSLLFEKSNSLLVAWGDCLMSMGIRDVTLTTAPPVGSAMTGLDGGGANSGGTVVKRRTVECTMAWELDCVACGVVPLDEDNVVVLGLVPPLDEEKEGGGGIIVANDNQNIKSAFDAGGGVDETSMHHGENDLEVQIISRKDGAIVYSDSLPMLRNSPPTIPDQPSDNQPPQLQTPGILAESASSYNLLSSFALPRMDDAAEAEEASMTGQIMEQDFDLNVSSLFSPTSEVGKRPFRDTHLDWNLQSILFQEDKGKKLSGDVMADWHSKNSGDEKNEDDGDDDAQSVDSDDYGFVIKPLLEAEVLQHATTMGPAPVMVVTSGSDVVLSRMGDIDDAVAHALAQNKRGLALRRALRHKRQLRRYKLSDLVNSYLQAVLRLPQQKAALKDGGEEKEANEDDMDDPPKSLSLRRMKLAVQSMPVLLGGDVALWQKWAREVEVIPGALFLLRDHLPVRDPILPPRLYERVLETMLQEAEQMSLASVAVTEKEPPTDTPSEMSLEAEGHFLDTLVAWGPTKVLKEFMKLFKYIRERRSDDDSSLDDPLKSIEIFLQRRYLQTAAGYLNFPVHATATTTKGLEEDARASMPRFEANSDDSQDSLYDHSALLKMLAPRAPLASISGDLWNKEENRLDPSSVSPDNRMCLDAIARLQMMDDRYDLALRCFLAIGAFHSPQSMEELEAAAIEEVNNPSTAESRKSQNSIRIGSSSYEFVLGLIEFHHLHQFLLHKEYLVATDSKLFVPLFALLRLVGLELMGDFLIDHCVSPEIVSPAELRARSSGIADDDLDDRVRRETLPIDQVAEQLEQSPALLHWYLHQVFTRKPEIYVKFPYTANPPKAVTSLHQRHFNLYVQFAGAERDTAKSLSGTETYKVETITTPLLSFLKEALPLGGIRPVDARRLLEAHRSEVDDSDDENDGEAKPSIDHSKDFSLELAFIIEHYSEETEAEAKGILDLYLEGANSVVLAVSYAQRQQRYSSILWEKLITYCLSNDASMSKREGTQVGRVRRDGMLFGKLLEAAALSGADLARLVAKIPPGMVVEGLRPRLVAAVADYRFKLDIHEAAATASTTDKNALLREVTHRSRRGVRYHKLAVPDQKGAGVKMAQRNTAEIPEDTNNKSVVVPKTLRTMERRNRYSLAYSLPMR